MLNTSFRPGRCGQLYLFVQPYLLTKRVTPPNQEHTRWENICHCRPFPLLFLFFAFCVSSELPRNFLCHFLFRPFAYGFTHLCVCASAEQI